MANTRQMREAEFITTCRKPTSALKDTGRTEGRKQTVIRLHENGFGPDEILERVRGPVPEGPIQRLNHFGSLTPEYREQQLANSYRKKIVEWCEAHDNGGTESEG